MTKNEKRVTWGLLSATVLLALLSLWMLQEKSQLSQDLNKQKVRYENQQKQLTFLKAHYAIDSLVLNENTERALEMYRRELESAPDSLQAFSKLRFKLVQRIHRLQSSDSAIIKDIERQLALQKSLSENANDSMQSRHQAWRSTRDSLRNLYQEKEKQLLSLRRELAEKDDNEFLTFTGLKGNKIYYIGETKNNMANGHGVGIWLTGSKYEGEWQNNKRHGMGRFEWADGVYYQGEYKDDKRHGQGTYVWANGEKYVGQWSNDKRSGFGKFYNSKGELLTQGTWENDELAAKDSVK